MANEITNEEAGWLDEFWGNVQTKGPTGLAHSFVMCANLESDCKLNDLLLCALGKENISKVRGALRRGFRTGKHIVEPEGAFFANAMRLLSKEYCDGISDRLSQGA